MTVALCLPQSSLRAVTLAVCCSIPVAIRGEPPMFVRDVVAWHWKPWLRGQRKAQADHFSPLPPISFGCTHRFSHTEEVTGGPQQSLAKAKQNKDQGQDQLWISDSSLHCAASISDSVHFLPASKKENSCAPLSQQHLDQQETWPSSFCVTHFSVNSTKIKVTDGSHVALLA